LAAVAQQEEKRASGEEHAAGRVGACILASGGVVAGAVAAYVRQQQPTADIARVEMTDRRIGAPASSAASKICCS
jgi:hypothetical protein